MTITEDFLKIVAQLQFLSDCNVKVYKKYDIVQSIIRIFQNNQFVTDTDYKKNSENQQQMEKESSDVSAKILLEIRDAFMHRFINNKKSLFTSGICKIAKIDHNNGSTIYFINMNSFYYTLRKDIVFIKIEYDQSVSYLFPHFQNGLSCISLLKSSPSIPNLQEILGNAATLTNYQTAMSDPTFRNKIETHCKDIAKESPYSSDSVKGAITDTGKLLNTAFTFLGGLVKQGVSKAGEYINTKLEPGQGGEVNPQTKQKWENIKKGTTNILQMSKDTYSTYLEPFVKPVVEKGLQQFDQIKEKINRSQNENVKYARELAETTQRALGEAFEGLVLGSKQVGEQLTVQTKKIVQKKYGEDYVKTFIEGEDDKEKPKQQEKQTHNQTQDRLYPDLDDTKH